MSLLAVLIALGALKGYQIFKGKITKKVKPIIIIISLLIVIFSNLVIIPYWFAEINDVTINYFYENETTRSALLKDLIVSVLFAIMGISVAISSINKVLMENGLLEEQKEIMEKTEELRKMQIDSQLNEKDKIIVNSVRDAFESLNASSKDGAVSKEEIINRLSLENSEKVFNKFKSRGVIVKYKGKYFYDKTKETFLTKQYWIMFIIMIVIISAVSAISAVNTDTKNTLEDSKIIKNEEYVFEDNTFSVKLPTDWEKQQMYPGNMYMYNGNERLEIGVIYNRKEDFEISLEEYRDLVEVYIGKRYEIENDGIIEKCQINGNEAYSITDEIIVENQKLTVVAYCVETENYLLEIYTFSPRSKSKENTKKFLEILNTLEEVKENN